MEESAAIKNIVILYSRLGYLLILRSNPDSVSQGRITSLTWKDGGTK